MRGLFLWPLPNLVAFKGTMMDKVTNTTISRAFSKAARWQIIITVLITGVSLLVAGVNAAISAFAGGSSVIAGGYAGMLIAQVQRRSASDGSDYIAES